MSGLSCLAVTRLVACSIRSCVYIAFRLRRVRHLEFPVQVDTIPASVYRRSHAAPVFFAVDSFLYLLC